MDKMMQLIIPTICWDSIELDNHYFKEKQHNYCSFFDMSL